MLTRARITSVCLVAAAAALIAGCGSPKKTSTQTAAASASACMPAKLKTHTHGTLTVATDSPAYPPYFEHNNPSNGKGFESAVAYAVAAKLGYQPARSSGSSSRSMRRTRRARSRSTSTSTRSRSRPPRAKVVTFSTPYYTNPQGIIVAADSPYAHAKTLAALKSANIGVQIGTTSLTAVTQRIKPTHQPQVFNTSNDVVEAFKIGRVNAIVVDLATAFDLTSTSCRTPRSPVSSAPRAATTGGC